MSKSNDMAAFDFGGPAIYRIVVEGTVSENWHRRLGGMEVTLSPEERAGLPAVLPGRWVGGDPVYDGVL